MTMKSVGSIPVHIFKNDGCGKGGIVMIQEWWGVTPQLKLQAKHLSKLLNCTVLVPDLYDGKSTVDAEEAHHLMDNLNWPGAVDRLQEVGTYLKEQEACSNIAVIGFCMGGALSVAGCTNIGSSVFSCGAAFYGVPPIELSDPSKCTIPMIGHFGSRDTMTGFSDPAACEGLEKAWETAGIEYQMHRYPVCGHAFMNDTEESVARKYALGQIGDGPSDPKHDEESIKLAWSRTAEYFKKFGI